MNANEFNQYVTYDPIMSINQDATKIIIQTKNLELIQTDLGLTIDVPFSALCKIETIKINGVKFVRENDYEYI